MDVELKKQEIDLADTMRLMRVSIDMASLKEDQINRVCQEFYSYGKTFLDRLAPAEVLPKEVGEITTLKTPCGQGKKTWSRYKIFVFLRKFCLEATHQQLEKIVQFLKNFSNVEIDLSIQN